MRSRPSPSTVKRPQVRNRPQRSPSAPHPCERAKSVRAPSRCRYSGAQAAARTQNLARPPAIVSPVEPHGGCAAAGESGRRHAVHRPEWSGPRAFVRARNPIEPRPRSRRGQSSGVGARRAVQIIGLARPGPSRQRFPPARRIPCAANQWCFMSPVV